MTAAVLSTLKAARDAFGSVLLGLRSAPNYTEQLVLSAASTAYDLVVPAGADKVVFTWNTGNIQVKAYTAAPPAGAPTGSTTDGSGWEWNPQGYSLETMPGGNAIVGFAIQGDTAGAIVAASFYVQHQVN